MSNLCLCAACPQSWRASQEVYKSKHDEIRAYFQHHDLVETISNVGETPAQTRCLEIRADP